MPQSKDELYWSLMIAIMIAVYLLSGRVIDGWETLDDLEKIPVHEKNYRPLTEIRLRRITIHANPLA